jgi:hypothetical protein
LAVVVPAYLGILSSDRQQRKGTNPQKYSRLPESGQLLKREMQSLEEWKTVS